MKNINTLQNQQLQDFRKSIDNLDQALVCLLAERFRVTKQVGLYKRDHHLPPQDTARETAQLEHIKELALQSGLDPQVATSILRLIMDEVVLNHRQLKNN